MNSSDGMLIVNVSAIQAVAIAAVTYYFGAWLRKKVPFLEKYSVPSPVVCVGGYVGCTGTFLPGIFPFHESQL